MARVLGPGSLFDTKEESGKILDATGEGGRRSQRGVVAGEGRRTRPMVEQRKDGT